MDASGTDVDTDQKGYGTVSKSIPIWVSAFLLPEGTRTFLSNSPVGCWAMGRAPSPPYDVPSGNIGTESLPMNKYAKILKRHIAEDPPNYGNGDASAILDMLYCYYHECNNTDNNNVKAAFEDLYQQTDRNY